jgi:hypothetical protein
VPWPLVNQACHDPSPRKHTMEGGEASDTRRRVRRALGQGGRACDAGASEEGSCSGGEGSSLKQPGTADADGDPSSAELASEEGSNCVMCMSEAPTHAMIPCGHLCVGATCADAASTKLWFSTNARCPVCRELASALVRIYI